MKKINVKKLIKTINKIKSTHDEISKDAANTGDDERYIIERAITIAVAEISKAIQDSTV